jgi:hypothetical protein
MRNIVIEHSLVWALGMIFLLWMFVALRACGVFEVLKKVIS